MRFYYRCTECGKNFEISPKLMLCPECYKKQDATKPLRGILEVGLEGEISENWLIEDLMPISKDFYPEIPVGNTPLWKSKNLNKHNNVENIYLKDDTRNPTGSLKDRASYLVAAFALKYNIREIALASTGNAASSMAGIGAATNLDITIFLPETAPKAKMVQSLQYGANVIPCAGPYDNAYEMSLEYTNRKKNVLSRNTAYNPLTIEGKKTAALEVFKQLGKVPDYVFVPTGDGVVIGGVFKGFKDLMQFGLINKMPEIIAVQARDSSAIHSALKIGKFQQKSVRTIADSISVEIPRNGYYVLKQMKKYNGKSITVTDNEILTAQKELSSVAGLFAEPAASASYAGYKKLKNEIENDKDVVLLITGNGLKDIDAAMKKIEFPDMGY